MPKKTNKFDMFSTPSAYPQIVFMCSKIDIWFTASGALWILCNRAGQEKKISPELELQIIEQRLMYSLPVQPLK